MQAKIKGKKRHILVDTLGLLLHAIVHSAGIQDRDGGISLLATLFGRFPFLAKLFAEAPIKGRFSLTCSPKSYLVSKPKLSDDAIKRKGRAVTQALDRRTHDCLAQPLPPPRQGMGKPQP